MTQIFAAFAATGVIQLDTTIRRMCGIEMPWPTLGSANIKRQPEDFVVQELLDERMYGPEVKGTIVSVTLEHQKFEEAGEAGGWRYAAILVTKRNVSHSQMLRRIANAAGIYPGQILCAGRKDSKAVTAQMVLIPAKNLAVLAQNLDRLNNGWELENRPIFIQFFSWSDQKFGRGSAAGNRFTIRLFLDEGFDKAAIDERLERVAREGFYNFFGEQRFSVPRGVQHRTGWNLLLGRFRQAGEYLLFADSPFESADMREKRAQARELYKADQIAECVNFFESDRRFLPEQQLLEALLEYDKDWEKTFTHSESKVYERAEFSTQAYLSLEWNTLVGRLITEGKHCSKPLPMPYPDDDRVVRLYKKYGIEMPPAGPAFSRFFHRAIYRQVVVIPENLSWEWVNETTLELKFDLPAGAYATTLMEHVADIRQ